MKKIIILGSGTAGTIMANKLRRALFPSQWSVTIVDKHSTHYYQPGFLFIPFGTYQRSDVEKSKRDFIPDGVEFVQAEVSAIDAEHCLIVLENAGTLLYDILIIATGTMIRPDQTPGLLGELWYKQIFDFYTLEGSLALHDKLKDWTGGTLAIAIADLPYKCPVAPLEFAFLADEYFTKRGIRDKVTIKYVTPLSGAFTKPLATRMLSQLLAEKNIEVIPDFYIESVDNERLSLLSYDGKDVKFDILTIVPVNMGSEVIEGSGLGDDLNHVVVDKYTMQSTKYENIFAVGDAANLPTSKAGSVAHFAADVLFENIMSYINRQPLESKFDGHANCYIETGFGKGTLIDFNYDTEPLPGNFPLPIVGPFALLKTSYMNHWGKLAFRWIYWHLLIKGKKLPVTTRMSMTGKKKVNQ